MKKLNIEHARRMAELERQYTGTRAAASRTKKPKNGVKARIVDLEDAMFEIYAHHVNICHHTSNIEAILRSLFSEREFLIRSQGSGKNGMFAEDLFKMMKQKFEPESKSTKQD